MVLSGNPSPAADSYVPTSVVLKRLLETAPDSHVTLGWLMASLQERSFGIVMLLMALVGLAPGVSVVAGPLLAIVAIQMILDRRAPLIPRMIASRRLATHRFARLVTRLIPMLVLLESVTHPRWPTPFHITKRTVGVVVLLVTLLLLVPIPLSNVPPALAIMLLSLAYLERDGVLLAVALLAALILLAIASVAVWGTLQATT
jgi:hypothetical protein